MSTHPTTEQTRKPPPSPESYYCACALPIAVEQAERHGAAQRVCARCGLRVPVRWNRR